MICNFAVEASAQNSVSDFQERRSKVVRLLSAIQKGDEPAIAKEGVIGVPYYLGYDQPKPQTASPFDVESLAAFASCKALDAEPSAINWLSVQWDCPAGAKQPWRSTQTAFKFDGMKITEIRTTPGAAILFSSGAGAS